MAEEPELPSPAVLARNAPPGEEESEDESAIAAELTQTIDRQHAATILAVQPISQVAVPENDAVPILGGC